MTACGYRHPASTGRTRRLRPRTLPSRRKALDFAANCPAPELRRQPGHGAGRQARPCAQHRSPQADRAKRLPPVPERFRGIVRHGTARHRALGNCKYLHHAMAGGRVVTTAWRLMRCCGVIELLADKSDVRNLLQGLLILEAVVRLGFGRGSDSYSKEGYVLISISGSCLCGSVTYQGEVEPVFSGNCHCTDCRKLSGGGHLALLVVPTHQISIAGNVTSHTVTADSGAQVSNHFCPNCGSQVFKSGTYMADMTFIVASTLEDPEVYKPEVSVYASRALSWDQPHLSTRAFDTMPPEL